MFSDCYEFGKYFSSCDKKVHNCAVGNLRNQFECEVPECADGWKGNACLDSGRNLVFNFHFAINRILLVKFLDVIMNLLIHDG